MIEIYKSKYRLNPPFMIEIFGDKEVPYQLRSTGKLNLPKVRTTNYGTDTVRFKGQRAWAKLPIELKASSSLTDFRKYLKSEKSRHCNLISK